MDIKTIEKFFNGRATEEEKHRVMIFFKEKELNTENSAMLKTWWDSFVEENTEDPSNKILRGIHEQVNFQVSHRKTNHFKWLGVAAAILVIFCVSYLFYHITDREQDTPITEMITKETPDGVKLNFKLPDGSLVYLNSGSKITYHPDFDSGVRKVQLEGEAFFEVAENPDQPFVVDCNNLITTVLGTSFNITSQKDNMVVVSVTSGKVKVDHRDNNERLIYLSPGEEVLWDNYKKQGHIQHFDPYKTVAWKEGIIIFDECGLTEIIDKLNKWYGVDVEVRGANINQINWQYSGEFDNESLENVLSGIAFVKDFKYKISGKKVQLYL